MDLTLGFIDDNSQLTITKLSNENVIQETEEIDSNDNPEAKENLKALDIYGLIYENTYPEDEIGNPLFVSPRKTLDVSPKMPYEEIITKVKEHSTHESIKTITKNIQNIFSLTDQLKELYKESRNDFFKETWQILRSSFCPHHLSIFFHNIDEKDTSKLRLQQISGYNNPKFSAPTQQEQDMFKAVKTYITPDPSVLSFDFKKGELTLSGQINGTSFLVLAKIFQFTLLQRTFFNTLINGINHQSGSKKVRRTSS